MEKRIIDLTSIELTAALSMQLKEQLKQTEDRLMSIFKNSNSQYKEEEKILTLEETASFFKVTRATIHDWMNKGIIKHYKKGNRTYFFQSELINSLKETNIEKK